MAKSGRPQITRELITTVFNRGNVGELVAVLQLVFTEAPPDMDGQVVDQVQLLTAHKDLGVRFWAKKVFQKYSFQFHKDEPERFSGGESGEILSLEILCKMLKDVKKSKFMAMKVLKDICRHNTPQALEVLLQYLKTTDDLFQISFLTKNLGVHFPSDQVIDALAPFLNHRDDRVVANTIEGLEAVRSPRSFEVISKTLKHKCNRVRANAAKAIATFDSARAFEILMKMLGAKDQPHLVISACHAIKELKDPRFLPLLQPVLNDDLAFDDALLTMMTISEIRTREILQKTLEKTETRMQKIKTILLRLPVQPAAQPVPKEASHHPIAPATTWGAGVDWLDMLFNRTTLFVGGTLVLILGLYFFATSFQTPEMARARDQLARMRISFTSPDFVQAWAKDNTQVIDLFLKGGMRVNVKNENGATPLHAAAHGGNVSLVDRLLGLGANVNIADSNGLTPLHTAANVEIAEKLIKRGANHLARDGKGKNPLHRASETGKDELVELLLAKGVDINSQARDGNTALHLALRNKQKKTALLLLSKGAKVDIRNQQGISVRDIGLPENAPRKDSSAP